ncbi:MAG: hypothetical protein V2A79_16580 [Planctomycetota bacterium]
MRRLFWVILLMMLGVTPISRAQDAPGTGDREIRRNPPQPASSKRDLRRFLRTRVAQVEWDDTPFGEVMDWLREQGQINVVVRWNILLEQGIDQDSPVSLRLKDATIATILSETLAQLSDKQELRYLGMGLTLTISTREDFNRKLYVRSYPVNDLLFRIPDFMDAPQVNLQQSGGGGGPGGGSATQNPFQGGSGGGGDEDNRSRKERVEELIEVVKETVEPESWRDAGGEGTIRAFNDNVLVVRANLEVHEKLGGPLMLEE